jgi:hypothetical protein
MTDRIFQRSLALKSRQWEFIDANPDIKLSEFVRKKIDEEMLKRRKNILCKECKKELKTKEEIEFGQCDECCAWKYREKAK